MKRESRHTLLTAALLAFLLSWSSIECLISAFDLPLEHPAGPVLVCIICALGCAAVLSFRYGSLLLLCLLVPASVWLYRDGTAAGQLRQLLHHLTTIYDRAYGLGVFPLPEGADVSGYVDFPLGIVGVMIVIAVCRCICCRKSLWLPVAAVLLPLSSCIVVTDTVPDEIWLFLVMAGLLLLILPQSVRLENEAQGNRLTAAAALPVALALGALFLMNPQDGYVNQSAMLRENILTALENFPQLMETGMNQIASGLQKQPDRQVDLAGLGPRIAFTYPVMEVTAEKGDTLYLREQDYDVYNGLSWQASEDRKESFPSASGPEESIVIRTQTRKNTRFLPYHPAGNTELEGGCAKNENGSRTDTLSRCRLPEDWRQTAYRNGKASPAELKAYTVLPDSTRQLAESYLQNLYPADASHTEKADMIAALVTDSARYSLNPEKMPPSEPDFALWFLREADSGYCIHFATAATVLLRAAGIPARYVTGYLVEAPGGAPVTVTEENAHAWAEYFEPALQLWLPLEATAAESQVPVTVSPQPLPPQPTEPPRQEPETTPPVSESTPETLPTVPPVPGTEPPSDPEPDAGHPGVWMLLPAFVLALLLQRSVRLQLRRKRQRTGHPNRQALYRWREALRLSRMLKESPTEELIILAQKAKFSQHELTPEELLAFDSFSRTCLRRLREKPWYLRLIYQYFHAAW